MLLRVIPQISKFTRICFTVSEVHLDRSSSVFYAVAKIVQ